MLPSCPEIDNYFIFSNFGVLELCTVNVYGSKEYSKAIDKISKLCAHLTFLASITNIILKMVKTEVYNYFIFSNFGALELCPVNVYGSKEYCRILVKYHIDADIGSVYHSNFILYPIGHMEVLEMILSKSILY